MHSENLMWYASLPVELKRAVSVQQALAAVSIWGELTLSLGVPFQQNLVLRVGNLHGIAVRYHFDLHGSGHEGGVQGGSTAVLVVAKDKSVGRGSM